MHEMHSREVFCSSNQRRARDPSREEEWAVVEGGEEGTEGRSKELL